MGRHEKILKNIEINSKDELKDMIKKIWEDFPQDSIDRLIQSFYGRLRMVIDFNGESISDELRKGIHKISEFPLPEYNDTWDLKDVIVECDPSV